MRVYRKCDVCGKLFKEGDVVYVLRRSVMERRRCLQKVDFLTREPTFIEKLEAISGREVYHCGLTCITTAMMAAVAVQEDFLAKDKSPQDSEGEQEEE